jgi:hypothetical protein
LPEFTKNNTRLLNMIFQKYLFNYFRIKLLFIPGIIFFSIINASAQGILRGKITDENGEPVIGAVIRLKSDPSRGTTADFDGNYSLNISDTSLQAVTFSFISFQTAEEAVQISKGGVKIKNIILSAASKEITEVKITGKAVKAKEYFVESMKKNSPISIDYISSETMKKTGDHNVVSAVARIPGVSTSGGIITVRGIGDRYVKTTINGMAIPTLDPFTNNLKLDLFPSSLIDNVIISKTANPNLPGDWAGAYLSIETKDYPEQLSISAESTLGYNNHSSFKNVLSSDRSSTDWLGYDNGFRDVDHMQYKAATVTPGYYQEFVALGLGAYYSSLGINQENWYSSSSTDTYLKLGLVQLGLLAPAQVDDPVAFANAKSEYDAGPYHNQAFVKLNEGVGESAGKLPSNWNTTSRKAPLNFSQSFSIGNQGKFLGKTVGFIAGFRYGSSISYDANSQASRASVVDDGTGNYISSVSSAEMQEVAKETNGWSSLINLACKLNSNNSFSLMFMPNLTGVNNVRNAIDDRVPANNVITKSQFYEQRRQLIYQIKSEHYLPATKIKISLNASYTDGDSKAPDFKHVQYFKDPISNSYQIGGSIGDGIHRYYRYLSDNLFDSRLSIQFPLKSKAGLVRKVEFGGSYQRNEKLTEQYDYSVFFGQYSGLTLVNEDLNAMFSPDNFNIQSYTDVYGVEHQTLHAYYSLINSPANHTFGNSTIISQFALADYAINKRLRISGGVRMEEAEILTDVVKFDSAGYEPNDPRRDYRDGYPAANPGTLKEIDILPSANLVYKLKYDDAAPVNLRLNYSRTIARPSIRELSDVAVFDYEFRAFVFGNSDLKPVHINNYDFRIEKYFKSNENVSFSVFYKDFKNHIELVNSLGVTWQNVDKSYVAGIECEGKKLLWKNFEIRANCTFLYSQTNLVRKRLDISGGVKSYIPEDTIKRPMFGQSPYVINVIVTHNFEKAGLTTTLSYNVQGEKLVLASNNKEIPDIYELPRHMFDIRISKKLSKYFSTSFTVRDILNSTLTRAYNYPEGFTLDYDRYNFGTNYSLSIAYKL